VLRYLAISVRSDIAHASRTLEDPANEDFVRVKQIFRYFRGTADRGLIYKSGYKPEVIEHYNNDDHGSDLQTGR